MSTATVARSTTLLREENERLCKENNVLKADIAHWKKRHHDAVGREEATNKRWPISGSTQFQLPAGEVYLSPMIDCFDGMVVSWTIGTSPDAGLVNTMPDTAIATLTDGERRVVHSDRGCQYRWPGWISKTETACLTRSMSKKGYSPDNAACEGFFGRLKSEMYYHRSWTNVSIALFIEKIDSYIRWYNEERIKLTLSGKSPVEYRASLGFAA